MMNVLDRLKQSGVVPVVVLDNAKDAAPTAKALLAGSVDVMEITFRTRRSAIIRNSKISRTTMGPRIIRRRP